MSNADRPEYFTPEEYLLMEELGLTKSEYIDGWIRAMSGSTLRHNRVKLNCLVQLSLKLRDQRCQPFDSDTKIRLDYEGKKRFYYPDAQVVCDSNELSSVFQDHPVLIIEVLSDSTEAYDRGKKFEHYRTIPSLQHYVMIAQDRHSIDCFSRTTDGSWSMTSCQGLDGKIALDAIDSELVGAEVYDKVVFAS
jgi:Uma2 family endonuclease